MAATIIYLVISLLVSLILSYLELCSIGLKTSINKYRRETTS